jgi:hypothetical protein
MIQVDIRHNIKSAAAQLAGLSKGMADTAIVRALNKTAQQGKTETVRAIKERYKIGTRVMSKSISIQRAGRNVLQARIRVEGRPLPMMAFNPRRTPRGVSVSISGRRFVVPHAFIATMKSGHQGVFARGGYKVTVQGTGENFGAFSFGKQRFPIGELFTFSLPQGFNNKAVQKRVQKRINEQFPKVLAQEINYLLLKS